MNNFARLLAPLRRKIVLSIGRAVIAAIDDTTVLQTLQLRGLKDEVLDARERLQEYGFTSRPHPGADAIMVALGGNRTNTVVVAVDDRRYRLKLTDEGDVALYSSGANHLVMKANGDIECYAPGEIKVACAGDATVTAGGEARVEGDIARLTSATATIVECAGHGFVLYPDYRDDYTIGAVAGTTYPIASPEITP